MAHYYSEADYCAEEMSRPYANPGRQYCHGEGGERYVVRKEEAAYEEIDEVERARRGYGHLGHGHGSASGHLGHSVRSHHHGHLGHSGSHLEHHHGHGGRHCDPCESKYDSCTVDAQYYG